MRSLKALSFLIAFATVAGCHGADEFYRLSDDPDQTGAAGSSSPGTGGTRATGTAGTTGGRGGTTGTAGSIISGAGGSVAGTAGATGAGGGGGSGTAGNIGTSGSTGAAGSTASGGSTGAAGSSAGSGAAAGAIGTGGNTSGGGSTGTAGTTSSRGGTTGTAGAAGGTSSRGGTTGTAGASAGSSGSGGATGAGGAGGRGPDRIQVVAKCQSSNDAQNTRVTFKILNPESGAKAWSDIKIRYYFTPNMPIAPMIAIDFAQKFTADQLTTTATTTYVEIGFKTGTGMVMGFDNSTGSDMIQLRLYNFTTTTWNTTWTDDYSYKSCAGVTNTDAYSDRLTMPGYYQGQLAWGSEPDAP
jgi:hypothetical protein